MAKSKTRAKSKSRTPSTCLVWLRRLVFLAIFIAAIAIVVAIVCANISKPEHQISSRLAALANNYYENVFYEDLLSSDKYSGDPEQALSKYREYGLSSVTLRQLLLADQASTAADADYLLEYCDENRTSAKFFPDAPYSRTDYHIDYHYSCNF